MREHRRGRRCIHSRVFTPPNKDEWEDMNAHQHAPDHTMSMSMSKYSMVVQHTLHYDYWALVREARRVDPTGVREYEIHWMGPEYKPRTSTGSRSVVVHGDPKQKAFAYCCTALYAGALLRCPDGLDVYFPGPANAPAKKAPAQLSRGRRLSLSSMASWSSALLNVAAVNHSSMLLRTLTAAAHADDSAPSRALTVVRALTRGVERRRPGERTIHASTIQERWDDNNPILQIHELHASRPLNMGLLQRVGAHVLQTHEPPSYNNALKTDDSRTMSRFRLGHGFLDRPEDHHVGAPYVLRRDLHHIYSPLRLSFAERTEKKAAVALVTNCGYGGKFPRAKLLKMLIRDFSVDSAGRCHKNTNWTLLPSDGYNCSEVSTCWDNIEMQRLARYKFVLAFENSVCDGYVTEKMMRAYRVQLVPVVVERQLGDRVLPGYRSFFPSNSYVNAAAFATVADLVAHLRAVESNETLWMSYMRHRNGSDTVLMDAQRQYSARVGLPLCRLARTAITTATKDREKARHPVPIKCLNQWPFRDGVGDEVDNAKGRAAQQSLPRQEAHASNTSGVASKAPALVQWFKHG